jgi:hypothetical protein
MPRIFSPTVAASIGLVILAFAAPGRGRARPAPSAHVDAKSSHPSIGLLDLSVPLGS